MLLMSVTSSSPPAQGAYALALGWSSSSLALVLYGIDHGALGSG